MENRIWALRWRPVAEADRLAINNHVEAENPRAAEVVDERIAARIISLLELPHRGQPGRSAERAN